MKHAQRNRLGTPWQPFWCVMARCREAVVSDAYKGFGVAYRGNEKELRRALGNIACSRRISDELAFVYYDYPQELQGGKEYPFGLMQKCYGLLSEQELSVSGVLSLREGEATSLYGSGTLLGFVDTGIDYAEEAFRYSDGSTRLLGLWDQTISAGSGGNGGENAGETGREDEREAESGGAAFYGTVFSTEEINQALAQQNPYEQVPSRDENGHGSALVRAAAGSTGRSAGEPDYGGAAPLASLAVVKLKQAKPYLRRFYEIPENAVCYAEEDIIYGIEWLLSVAKREGLPLVVCVALGSNQGNHTASTVLSRYLDRIARIPGVCVVVAGGNESGRGHHYFGRVPEGGYEDVELLVGEGEQSFCTELWAVQPDLFTVELTTPAGEVIPRIPGRVSYIRRYTLFFEGGSVDIQSNLFDPSVGTQGIWLRFSGVPAGIWKIRVYAEGEFQRTFHLWLPIEPFLTGDTRFLRPDPYTLICDPGAAKEVLTLAAYDAVSGALNLNSSFGYTADGTIKPDVAAPSGTDRFSGTGLAASFAGGCAALFMEAVLKQTGAAFVDTQIVKRLFTATAVRDRGEYPNREWGYGKLDLYGVFVRSPGRQ